MDPRSPVTTAELQQQLQLGQKIYAEALEGRRAQAEIESVQKQLTDLTAKIAATESMKTESIKNESLKAALADAKSEIAKILANKETQPQPAGLQDAYTDPGPPRCTWSKAEMHAPYPPRPSPSTRNPARASNKPSRNGPPTSNRNFRCSTKSCAKGNLCPGSHHANRTRSVEFLMSR